MTPKPVPGEPRGSGRPVPSERDESRDAGALEVEIGKLLRIGVVMSTTLLAAGVLISISGAADRTAELLLSMAIVILLATPPARVVVSIVEYIRERDWLFVTLTMIVLLTLAGSVVAAFWR